MLESQMWHDKKEKPAHEKIRRLTTEESRRAEQQKDSRIIPKVLVRITMNKINICFVKCLIFLSFG